MNKVFLSFLIVALCAITSIQAQGDRAPSPSAKLVQKVGLTDVTIEYSRPSMKDRKIFAADGLVPYGKIWRTGANAATKVSFSGPVKIGDGELAAGSYALLTTPNENSWEVHFFPYDGTRWSPYSEATPALTTSITPMKSNLPYESFIITVGMLRDYSAALVLAWENTVVSIPFTVE